MRIQSKSTLPSSNPIGDGGARYIADSIKVNSFMQSIDLSDNQIGDEGAQDIADSIKFNSSLQSIYLWNNNIGAIKNKPLLVIANKQ